MIIAEQKVWLIMSKDRHLVAKGTHKNRELVLCSNEKDKKRFITYASEGAANAGIEYSGFNNWHFCEQSDLEAVETTITINI